MKKFAALCLAMLLILGCVSGCKSVLEVASDIDLSTPFVGFRAEKADELDLHDYSRVSLETLNSYRSTYGGYGVTVYFDTLTPAEQTLYRIFQYALDHGQSCIFIDDRVLEGVESSLDEVLCCLALDCSMLEQNMNWVSWETYYTSYSTGNFGKQEAVQISGLLLDVENFSQAKLNQKLVALQTAEQIVSQMPAGLSDLEKAKYFYCYLGENTQYFALDNQNGTQDYLHDALCVGKTNCDGFANAYSLLCYLAGIPCLEKLYTPAQTDEIGHTWNGVFLDGVWYNVDATGSSEVMEDFVTMRGFCVSDDMMEDTPNFIQRIPPSTTDLVPPDCRISDTKQAGKMVKDAYKKVKKTDRTYVIALFPNGEVSDKVMQEIADGLGKSINTRYYLTHKGEAVYYIFPG